MRKILLAALMALNTGVLFGQVPIMYFPNNVHFTYPDNVYKIDGTPEQWYKNLQKYWYYRYRLVNDFLFISDNNEAGSSIPAIKRIQDDGWNEEPTIDTFCGSCNTLSWGDATLDLAHYMQMLATEEELLSECAHPVDRSQYELKHALDAFDRLDDNAEQYCYEVAHNVGTYHGYPGTLGATSMSYSDRHNGFFIRDDVPALTLLDVAEPGNKYKHFNREGLKRTWTYPGADGSAYRDKVNRVEGNFTATYAELYNSLPVYHKYHRWEGSIGTHTIPHSWIYLAPRYPGQESQDHLIDLGVGFALICNYSTDAGILTQAADALYRSVKYPFSSWLPLVRDPLNPLQCVYGIVPETYPITNCDAAGANYWPNALGGAHLSNQYADPLGYSSSSLMAQANAVGSGVFWALAQYGHLTMRDDGCADSRDQSFPAYYACLTNSWSVPLIPFGAIPTTWKNLKKICNKDAWGKPHLPLIYELIYNPSENYRYMDYMNVLNAAPPCGPYNFSQYHHDLSGTYPFRDLVASNPYLKNWTGGDWLSQPQDRWRDCTSPDLSRSVTFNGLDYMILFNLFALKQGSSYLKNLNNPFWDNNYSINYPDNYTIGSNTIPLYLNFLEYAALKGTYNLTSNVSIRGGKQIELETGFNSFPDCNGCFTDITIRDYGCDEEYTFALIAESGMEHMPANGEEPNSLLERSSKMPTVDSSLMLADSLLTDEMEKHYYDSLLQAIIDTGNEYALAELRKWGINVDSIMTASRPIGNQGTSEDNNNSELFVDVYPNPASDMAYVKYKLLNNSKVDIKVTNSIGVDIGGIIESYLHEQEPRDYAIGVNTANLPQGLYLVTIKINGKTYSKKLTVL